MNPKSASGSAAGSIYVKSSESGSAVSSFAAPSDMDEPVTSDSKPPHIEGPMQQILIETFNIPAHLTHQEKVADLHVCLCQISGYSRYGQKGDSDGGDWKWTQKKPPPNIVEVFMSKSGYFNRPKKYFPSKIGRKQMQLHHVMRRDNSVQGYLTSLFAFVKIRN